MYYGFSDKKNDNRLFMMFHVFVSTSWPSGMYFYISQSLPDNRHAEHRYTRCTRAPHSTSLWLLHSISFTGAAIAPPRTLRLGYQLVSPSHRVAAEYRHKVLKTWRKSSC